MPNKEKTDALRASQIDYTDEANRFIGILNDDRYLYHLAAGSARDSDMRELEKINRCDKLSATFSQSAFDEAFTKMANRMDAIRKDILPINDSCLVKSKVLFGMCITGHGPEDMIHTVNEMKESTRKQELLAELSAMKDFDLQTDEVRMMYRFVSDGYKLPHINKAHVRLVSTNFKFGLTDKIKADAVLSVSLPSVNGYIDIPLNTSANSVRRILQYGACHSAEYTIRDDGSIQVTIAFKKDIVRPKTTKYRGVDVGISDAFHTDDTGAIGTLQDVIDYYKQTVEPSFAEISNLRNKKRQLVRYLKVHQVPEDVERSIRDKIDRLDHMIRMSKEAQHKANRYSDMLDKRIRDVVGQYISTLTKDTMTVMELLDIKEFHKSRKVNGMFSMFARGKLSEKLIAELNWHGFDFMQVDPAYTSQTCPVCSLIDANSRHGKSFKCTCCGYKDDADHVGSINIKARATDEEILNACDQYRYQKNARHAAIKKIQDDRHQSWIKMKPAARM